MKMKEIVARVVDNVKELVKHIKVEVDGQTIKITLVPHVVPKYVRLQLELFNEEKKA